MSDYQGLEDILQDFLVESGDLLADVEHKLVNLEQRPDDAELLNDIFRGFHTIKGGASFLNAHNLVGLCQQTESLFDKLRTHKLTLSAELMDVIMAAMASVRSMFEQMQHQQLPTPADAELLHLLQLGLEGQLDASASAKVESLPHAVGNSVLAQDAPLETKPDWGAFLAALTGKVTEAAQAPKPPMPVSRPAAAVASTAKGQTASKAGADNSIRVDTGRLDQVLNLSGEIGLTKNRLMSLRSDILGGRHDAETLTALDASINHLSLLVSDLQNAVMKTRMQPIGRLFQKYPRLARDLARQLGKEVELELVGEDTEIDKTMVEDLGDPLIHIIRNAVDHGIEMPDERTVAGKPVKAVVRLEACQEGDHILIRISDDGKGMNPAKLQAKAIEKGLISAEEARGLSDTQSFNLIFLPGFSTAEKVTDVSGRGVGMDVVRTKVQRLNGQVSIDSVAGVGTTFTISLPLTLAILPVLLVKLEEQPFAVPLSMVREIIPVNENEIQRIGGKATMSIRGEILPVQSLADLLGWPKAPHSFGVILRSVNSVFVLTVDGLAGRDDAVIKPLDDFKPKGVSGVTTMANGQIVLILDMAELLS